MKKFEVGKKYKVKDGSMNNKQVGTVEILNRTLKFITYHDDFFNRTKRIKVVVENDVEKISGWYIGTFANDEVA